MGLAATSRDLYNADSSSVSETNFFVAKMNAYYATAIASLRKDSSGSFGELRKNLYQETFRPYIPKRFHKMVGEVCTRIQN